MQITVKTFSVRIIGAVNWLGLWTLFSKEVMRFVKVGFQTVLAPIISAMIFFLIFKFAFGETRPEIHGVPYSQFLVPGLIMMGLLNQSFANTASSLIISKVQGNSVDFLMPPLSVVELLIGFVAGAATRGVIVGLGTGLAMMFLATVQFAHLGAVLWFGFNAVLMMAMIGLLAGIAGNRFEHLAAFQNFVLLPLTMLSGTFYSIKVLPQALQDISLFNPFFYLIDGFRFGFTGVADGNIFHGVLVVGGLNFLLTITCYLVLASGWRLKT